MLALIQRKVEGEDITVAPTDEPEHKIIDIMEALKASLAAGNARKPAQQADQRRGEKGCQAQACRQEARRREVTRTP